MAFAIFISYRQTDSKGWASLLRDALVARFGAGAVFLDKDGLGAGEWNPQLDRALRESRAVLVLIGLTWLGAADEHGHPRLEDEADVHRREIATALKLPEATVIPVLVDGAALPREKDLPPSLRALTHQQAYELSVRAERRIQDVALLVAEIARVSGLEPRPLPDEHSLWNRAGSILRLLGTALAASFVTAAVVAVGAEAVFNEHLANSEVAVVAALAFALTLAIARVKLKRRTSR